MNYFFFRIMTPRYVRRCANCNFNFSIDMQNTHCQYCTYLHITPTTTLFLSSYSHTCLHTVHKTRETFKRAASTKIPKARDSVLKCFKTPVHKPIYDVHFNTHGARVEPLMIFFGTGVFLCIYVNKYFCPDIYQIFNKFTYNIHSKIPLL
jgi:hypothetical protein